MTLKDFIFTELKGWGKYERIIFPLVILLIILISIYLNDSKIALVSAICGISYTILAGKGKISCYLFGLSGTMCYAYLSFKNALYGNLILYSCYYFPMQILGIFQWKKHLNKKSKEIIKTMLSLKLRLIFLCLGIVSAFVLSLILKLYGDPSPYIDGITTVFSIIGLLFTVKRLIEQWYVWTIVNGISVIMWIQAYQHGSNCFATILMWCVYFVLGLYFLLLWQKELKTFR